MQQDNADLATLIGSRICHDLISPIGAISNGLELLTLNGAGGIGPEFDLINDSCSSATARIRFFRVAFGTSSAGQQLRRDEVVSVLEGIARGTRLQTQWHPDGNQHRRDVQLAFLALLCFETALPQGGTVVFDLQDGRWQIAGTGPRLSLDPDLWKMLTDPSHRTEISPARVQFAMLQVVAADHGRAMTYTQADNHLRLQL
ncbi:histidine phosphotransferase family protein [Puniceibacterium confluentis]|uniref:histidine phosphotransferase family protein n=1 Tax=Puniceibacterium confluentis TaxID=1958944 RepID=UPI00356712C5